MSVLAVVSKAIFEKEARASKKLLGVGDVWPTSRYASQNPALEPLGSGGDLHLVTVRPGDVLWLVAVLVAPEHDDEGWVSKPNATPIRDITALLPKLRFASGKGITAAPGKLGMSPQTPRALTDDDVLLLQAPATASAAYAQVLAEAPVMKAAAAHAAESSARAAKEGAPGLRLERRRAPWSALTKGDKKLLAELAEELSDVEARAGIEVVDVVDEATSHAAYLLALWPFGSGVLVDVTTKEIVADIVQHDFAARSDPALGARLEVAYHRGREALGVREQVSFVPGSSQAELEAAAAKPIPKGSLLERIEAARRAIASGTPLTQEEIWALVTKAIDFRKSRPLPLRRLFELDATTRAALELIHEGYEHDIGNLGHVGLPPSAGLAWRRDPAKDPGDLARFLGHAPAGPLDTPVKLGGELHPASFLVSDAVHELRPVEQVIDALLTLTSDVVERLWSALSRAPLGAGYATPPPGAQRGSPTSQGAFAKRYLRFLIALGMRLPDRGERVATAILAERADWERWVPQLSKSTWPNMPYWFEQCMALGMLGARAHAAGGELDDVYDERLSALAMCFEASYPIHVILEDLPLARAARIARAQLELMEHFPAPESADAALRRLETVGGGPYTEPRFRRIIEAIGPPAIPALQAALARDTPMRAVVQKCLSALEKKAKPPAKKR